MNKMLKNILLGATLMVITGTAMAMQNHQGINIQMANEQEEATLIHPGIHNQMINNPAEATQNQQVNIENQDIAPEEFPNELMKAANENNIVYVQTIVQMLRQQNEIGQTALHIAAKAGNIQIVRMLKDLEKGIRDNYRYTPLMRAAEYDHPECVTELLDEAGNVIEGGATAMMIAALFGQAEVVRRLTGKEAGMRDDHGWSALMHAAASSDPETVSVLLDTVERADAQAALEIAENDLIAIQYEYIPSLGSPFAHLSEEEKAEEKQTRIARRAGYNKVIEILKVAIPPQDEE